MHFKLNLEFYSYLGDPGNSIASALCVSIFMHELGLGIVIGLSKG